MIYQILNLKLENLIVFVDNNRFQATGKTSEILSINPLDKKFYRNLKGSLLKILWTIGSKSFRGIVLYEGSKAVLEKFSTSSETSL